MSPLFRVLLGLAALSFLAPAAWAETAPSGGTGFRAEAAETPPVAPDDIRGQLVRCDFELRKCEQDSVGVPFLGAAYVAFLAILLVFFWFVRQRQLRLARELKELRARLARLTRERDEASAETPSTTS